MKKLVSVFLGFILLSFTSLAKDGSLVLSNAYPEAGKAYTFTYNPAGTPVEGLGSINIRLFCFTDVNKNATRSTVKLSKVNGIWKGSIQLPVNAKAFYFSIRNGVKADDNSGKGYVYMVYNDGKPVDGAYGCTAGMYTYGNYQAGTTKNIELADSLLKMELENNAQNKKSFLSTWFVVLLNSKNQDDQAILNKELYKLLESNNEKDWQLAQNFFWQQKKNLVVDSINAVVKVKFPLGEMARSEELQAVYNETDVQKKEALYKAWIKKFPPQKSGGGIIYDYASNAIAQAYAKEGNVKKTLEYANMVQTPAWKGEGWAGPAGTLVRQGFTTEALALYKKALNNSMLFRTTKKDEDGADFAAMGYPGYSSSIAGIYYNEKKYKEALVYIEKAYNVYKEDKKIQGYTNAMYASILKELGKNKEAFEKIDEAIKAGQANENMIKDLKELYVKVNGSDAGYEEYLAKAKQQLVEKFKRELPRQMINVPAPQFTLKDLEGNTVSLSDLKGKTVVVDFWATWCGPCKASFPAMQMAVNKYKDDPNVKFLFIHTWERGEGDATEVARKYITDMKYAFQVLLDLKDKETATNKVVESFDVSGIPTKFIIDKNGKIRFRMTGFSGGNDAAVEELTVMIELAQKAS